MKQSAFIAALKFASHAMAAKDIRYYLNGVLFEFRGTTLTLVGTDGHRMAYVELTDENGTAELDFIVEAASVKVLLPAFKVNSTADIMFEHGTDVLIVRGAGDMAIPCKPIEGNFPYWRRVCKADRAPVATESISFNASYLADASKACGALSSTKYSGVNIKLFGPSESILVTADAVPVGIREACVVVMPMRL